MSIVTVILTWPLEAIKDIQIGAYTAAIAAVAATLYWNGGIAIEGKSAMDLATSYVLGGVVYYAIEEKSASQ